MSVIYLDPDAIATAQSRLQSVHQDVCAERTRHDQIQHDFQWALSGAANIVREVEGVAHALDPWHVWERSGLGGIANACQMSRGSVEEARDAARAAIQQVCDAQSGPVGTDIWERASGLDPLFGTAVDGLIGVGRLLYAENVFTLLEAPSMVTNLLSAAHGALTSATQHVESLGEYLAELAGDADTLIQSIARRLIPGLAGPVTVTRICANPSARNASQLPGTPASLAPGTQSAGASGSGLGTADALALGAFAFTLSSLLGPGSNGARNRLDLDQIPDKDLSAQQRDTIKSVFALDPKDWGQGLVAGGGDVECVAFVNIVYALKTGHTVPFTGNAIDYWTNYGPGGAHPMPAGWTKVPNGSGLPWPGDIIVMSDGGLGHVGIVSSVTPPDPVRHLPGSMTFANANSPKTSYNFTIAPNGTVRCDWSGFTIEGFLRDTNL